MSVSEAAVAEILLLATQAQAKGKVVAELAGNSSDGTELDALLAKIRSCALTLGRERIETLFLLPSQASSQETIAHLQMRIRQLELQERTNEEKKVEFQPELAYKANSAPVKVANLRRKLQVRVQ